jgi:hypothetical protein
VRAVAAHRIGGPLLVAAVDGQRDTVGVLAQPSHLGAADGLHAQLAGSLLQQRLGARLPDDQHVGEPAVGMPQVEGDLAVPQVHPHLGQLEPRRHQLVGDPSHAQQFQRAGMQGERSGEVGLPGPALQDLDGDAGGGQVAGEHEAGRSGTRDEHAGHGVPLSSGPPCTSGWPVHGRSHVESCRPRLRTGAFRGRLSPSAATRSSAIAIGP